MRKIALAGLLGLVGAFGPLQAQAQEGSDGSGIAVLGRFGTLGLGLEFGRALSEKWALRFGLNGYSGDVDITESEVDYEAEVELRNAGFTLDWHPTAGAFRVSGGAYYNGAEIGVLARVRSGSVEINDTRYNANEIGSLSGNVTFKRFAPYVGVGFGNVTRKGFSYSVDLGAFYQRTRQVSLAVTCGSVVARCAQLQADVQTEQEQLRDDLDDYRLWPVIQVGFGYVF